MRRVLQAFMLSCPLALAACEDGPTQPFSAAPANAGAVWNNGNTPGISDPAKQGYTAEEAGVPDGRPMGTNKVQICTDPLRAKRWAWMVKQPIVPPHGGAGLDLAGGDTWKGLTIEEAEGPPEGGNPESPNGGLCQSEEGGDVFSDGTEVNYWGDNAEVWFDYNVQTRRGLFMVFLMGYVGAVEADSPDGKNHYRIPIATQITKNGQPFQIDWTNSAKFQKEVDELGEALLYTYAIKREGVPPEELAGSCTEYGRCIVGNFGDVAYIYLPLIGLGLWTPNMNAPQPTPSILDRIDIYLSKVLPFSFAYPYMTLAPEGPVASPRNPVLNTATGKPCAMKFGVNFGDFLSDCVQVFSDPTLNQTSKNKLLGGIMHGREKWHFDIDGVGIDFYDTNLAADKIIGDNEVPDPTDVAFEFGFNQAIIGKIVNDRKGGDLKGPRDNHGAGQVYLEYARLVQEELNKSIPKAKQHGIGDPACLAPNVDPLKPVYPDGCTGFEGFTTCAPKSGDPNFDRVSVGWDDSRGYPTCAEVHFDLIYGLKPGHPAAAFCLDATGSVDTGFKNCVTGDIWATSFKQVLSVFGKGEIDNLPYEIRDNRFFFKTYMKALVKYLMAAKPDGSETVDEVHNAKPNPDDLHFDSAGGGQFEIGEYVDRRFAQKGVYPTDLVVIADIKNGIFNNYEFTRNLYRGEKLVYAAVLEDQSHELGQEHNATLTNVFGSPVLKNGWGDTSFKSAWECATADPPTPTICGGQVPPLDENGQLLRDEDGMPILHHYPGAMGASSTVFTMGSTEHVKLTQVLPLMMSAKMRIDRFVNPYDPSSDPLEPMEMLVAYEPKQPGIGFPIAVNGQLDRFVMAYHCDLGGETISMQVIWDWAVDEDKKIKGDGSIEVLATQSSDFLGDVFLCQDAATRDLLRARMYSTTDRMLDWLNAHPSAYADCGIIIRYSPFGNYPDAVTSLTNGVRVGITQGGGKGRVVDATLWNAAKGL